jgi:hypothetical protein
MVHTAILGRRFDTPVVNLGFSGNGRMDKAVGDFLRAHRRRRLRHRLPPEHERERGRPEVRCPS